MSAAPSRPVDLRSDTVTRPTAAMRRAMAEAEVGDVCFGDDPTVARLEATLAERLGKEVGLFVPTGTMSNQVGVGVHVRPGDAVLLEARAHIARWEGGAASALSGAQLVTVEAADGLPAVDALEAALLPDHPKAPRPRLLALEDTHNAAGGRAHGAAAIQARTAWARAHGLATHLDGARLFHAALATGDAPEALAAPFDTVSICLSKGLGAPVGSVLLLPRDLAPQADRLRHRLGGGWRQAGVLAAAGLHALAHHVDRLADDHARARALAATLAATGVARATHPVETNLVCYEVDPAWGSAPRLTRVLAERGVLVAHTGPTTGRLVTHLDVTDADLDRALRALAGL